MALETIQKMVSNIEMPSTRLLMLMANRSGVAFFWVTSTVVCFSCVFFIIPNIFADEDGSVSSGGQTAMWILYFFAANMYINYLMSLFTSTYYDAGKLNVPTAEGGKNWGYCVPCQQYIPPRAHHCQVCSRCVLKRDAHCFFLGNCVGHTNQRFFIVYIFYTALGSFFGVLCYGTFLHREIGPIVSLQMPNYLPPYAVLKWLGGSYPTMAAMTLMLFYITLMAGLACTMLFCYQVNLVLHGQTGYEMARKSNEYDSGAQVNIREVFGRYWWLSFIIPVKFQQPVDGITWSRAKDIKKYWMFLLH